MNTQHIFGRPSKNSGFVFSLENIFGLTIMSIYSRQKTQANSENVVEKSTEKYIKTCFIYPSQNYFSF